MGSGASVIPNWSLHFTKTYGMAFLSKLRGEFALCIYDASKQCFVAAGDRYHIKPLFWTVAGSQLLISAEAKGFLPLGWKPEWDVKSVQEAGSTSRLLQVGLQSGSASSTSRSTWTSRDSVLAERFEDATYHCEHHNHDLNFVGKYALSEVPRARNCKAVLTGEGTDEQFAGYPLYAGA